MRKILTCLAMILLCSSMFTVFKQYAIADYKSATVDISAQYSSFVNAFNNYKKIFGQDVAIGQTVDRTLSGIINDPPAHYSWHSWAGQTYPDPPDGFSIRIETIQQDYVYKIIGLGYMGGSQPSASGWIKVNSPFKIEQLNHVFNYSWSDGSNVRLFVNKDTGDITFSAKWYNWPALIDACAFEFAITIAKPGGMLPPFNYDTTRSLASYAYDADAKRVVMFGGRMWEAMSLKSDIWTFDLVSSQWTLITTGSGPSSRQLTSMDYNSVDGKLLVYGGVTYSGETSDTWAFQFTGSNKGTWTQIPVAGPSARSGAQLIFDSRNNLFVLFGGERYVYSLDETWVFNPSTDTWSNRNPSPSPSQRARAAMAYDAQSGKALLFGGLNKGAGALLGDTWLYDAATNTWQQVSTPTAPSARQWPSLASDGNGVFYLFGGWRVDAGGGLGQYLDDTWKFDMATMQWTQLFPSESPIAQSQGKLLHIGSGKFVLIGGWRDSPLGDIWFYDSNQNTWSTEAVPSPYANYAQLAESRADAYSRYAQAVYFYSAESTVDFSTQLVQQAFTELAPIYADLLELELAENVLSATKATYNTIVDFKDYLDSLTDPLIEVINRFVYGAYASQTYSYLTSLESLCRQEADAWRSGDLNTVNSILIQEKEAIIPPMGAIPYALGFRRSAHGVDENAYEVADATIDFLNRETVEIATLQSIAKQKPGILASLHSPADLHVFDDQGHHVGAIYNDQGIVIDIETQIVNSYYSGPELEPEFLALLDSTGKSYTFEVIGRGEENPSICTLTLLSWDSEGNFIESLNLTGEIAKGEIWVYHVQATEEQILIELSAKTDIDPNTLNIWSKGVYVTSFLELPGGFKVSDIDIATILLNGTIPVDLSGPTAIGDYDIDGIPDLMVKFDRADVISYILANVNITELIEKRSMTITLTITGAFNDGTPFKGSDTIKIIYTVRRAATKIII